LLKISHANFTSGYKMISNIILPTANISSAEIFYDALLGLFGAKKTVQNNAKILWKCRNDNVGLMVCEQKKSSLAKKNHSLTIALYADSPAEVTMIYQVAMRLGATCAGEPVESGSGEYEAYFLDADKNKFGIVFGK
jgi:predicted lactoylglutathione lyase